MTTLKKVYLVWGVDNTLPFRIKRLKGIYSTRREAQKFYEYLEDANLFPVDCDGYGIVYSIYENDIKETFEPPKEILNGPF